MLDNNNLWEAARARAHEVLLAAGVPEARPDSRVPKVQVRGGWWRRWRTRRRVETLWRLAYGKRPRRLRRSGWQPLLREADWLRAGLADGTIRLDAA